MIFKRLAEDFAYELFIRSLVAYAPFLGLPWVYPFFKFFADRFIKPAISELGTFFDFTIIDMDLALKDLEFKKVVMEIDKLESQNIPLESLPDEEIKRIRDTFHRALDDLVKYNRV